MHFFLLLLFVLGVSSSNMTMIERIKANPKQFVEEMAKVDPTKLQEIIDLLEALRETSHTEESDLLGALDTAKQATADAAVAVAGAEEDKEDADAEVVTAQSDLATVKDTAETNIGTATSALDSRKTEANDAQDHLDEMVDAHTAREGEQAQAQENLDGELPSLNSEQETLVNVISILKNLIGSQHDQYFVHNGAGSGSSVLTDRNTEVGVRCCSETGGDKWDKLLPSSCPDLWGSSLQDDPIGSWTSQCRKLNWEGAKAACEGIGGRLCSVEEIKAGCTTNTGCTLNNLNVWTSSWE